MSTAVFCICTISDNFHDVADTELERDVDDAGRSEEIARLLSFILSRGAYQPRRTLDISDVDEPLILRNALDKRGRSYIGRRAAFTPPDNGRLPAKRLERERVYIGKRTRSSPLDD